MDKKFDAYKTIGEVSKELNIPTHIIRFWETKFERLKSVKRKNNHRYYSKEDIIFILSIKKLVSEEGYTIKGVQKLFRDGGLKKQPSQRKLSSKDVIVKTISVDEKNAEGITGLDTASLAELRRVLRELVSIKKFLDEV